MRKDMGKCVIERPRRGSSNPSEKVRAYGKITKDADGYDYEGFTKIPSSRHDRLRGWGGKDFTDVLGPIKRYLKSSCGRPWDDVYSEIKKTLGHCGWAVEHIIKDHIDVETNTWRGSDGHVYSHNTPYWRQTRGLDGPQTYTRFYVEPETGILRRSPDAPKEDRSQYRFGIPRPDKDAISLSDHTEYRRIDGIWYFQDYRETEIKVCTGTSQITGKPRYEYQTVRDIVVKRQLGKKELKRCGLTSNAPVVRKKSTDPGPM